MKYFIGSLLFLIICSASYSQSIYHLEYNFPVTTDTTHYDAFFVRHSDGTGFVRVNYRSVSTGELQLVELKMQEEYLSDASGNIDTNKLIYKTFSPLFVKGNPGQHFSSPVFVFSKDNSGFFEPSAVSVTEDATAKNKGVLLKVEFVKTSADLTKDFIAGFFNETDPFYINFFGVRTRGTNNSEIKMHVLIVANTNDPTIGPSCNRDMGRMLDAFQGIADFLGVTMPAPKMIYGDDYTLKNIRKAIDDIMPAPNDIVVFYYSGHGFRKDPAPNGKPIPYQKSRYPFLDFRAKPEEDYNTLSMNVEEIFKIIKTKKARFSLVLSDCCNNIPGATNRQGRPVGGAPRGAALDWSEDNISSLFLNPKKIAVLATAADIGQLATGSNSFGGFFSYFFKTSMETNFSVFKNNVTWKMIVDEAKTQTSERVAQTHCGQPPSEENRCKQNPFFTITTGTVTITP